ncbi:MAG TPA: hypothetical protein VK876_05015, partial [Rubrivivax sp.]|nr:hypothetical protein [Rubrivivax sp.]
MAGLARAAPGTVVTIRSMHPTSISSARGHSFACAAMALALMAGCASPPPAAPAAPAATTAAVEAEEGPSLEKSEQAFERWVKAFAATAREAGIAEETLRSAF